MAAHGFAGRVRPNLASDGATIPELRERGCTVNQALPWLGRSRRSEVRLANFRVGRDPTGTRLNFLQADMWVEFNRINLSDWRTGSVCPMPKSSVAMIRGKYSSRFLSSACCDEVGHFVETLLGREPQVAYREFHHGPTAIVSTPSVSLGNMSSRM